MKISISLILFLVTIISFGQELPKKSSLAVVHQRIGLTDVSITYSRPNVNDREIFGDLVPFGKVWRLGANEPTKIELSEEIIFGEGTLKPGTYALFAIPEKDSWKIVVNSDYKQWGSNSYDAEKNIIEYIAKVKTVSHTESFTITFNPVTESSAVLSFSWKETRVSIPISTNTNSIVERNITAAIEKGEKLERVYYNAADYYFDQGIPDLSMEYLEKSLAIERSYYNLFLKANLLKDQDLKEAKKIAEEAVKMAIDLDKKGWADYITRKTSEW